MSHSATRSTPDWRYRGHERIQSASPAPLPANKTTSCAGDDAFPLSSNQTGCESGHCITCTRYYRLWKLFSSQQSFLESKLENKLLKPSVDKTFLRQGSRSGVGPQNKMAYVGPYDALWQQQIRLFHEIGMLKSQIVTTEWQLHRAEESLAKSELKRDDRRKAKWMVKTNLRHLGELNRESRGLMRSLAFCQTQISHIHLAGAAGLLHIQSPTVAENWDHPFAGSDFAYPSQLPTFPYASIQRPMSTDSGFHEPPLYARPIDLDLNTDTSNHVFSHEVAHQIPTPTAVDSPPSNQILNPSATEFIPPSSQKPKREEDHVVEDSGSQAHSTEQKHRKRYSEAAISLIEDRLRKHKKSSPSCSSRDFVAKREEVSVSDVDVGVAAA